MKHIYRIILALTALITLMSSCEGNFDPQVYAAFPLDKYPKTKDDYLSLAMLCYVPYGSLIYNMGCGSSTAMALNESGDKHMFDTPTDLMAPMSVQSPGARWQRISRADFSDAFSASRGSRWLNHMLKIAEVTRMTKVISIVESAPDNILNAETKEKLLGEIHLCRGLHMYTILHMYGPMPMILDPELIDDEEALYAMQRPSLETAVQRITDDFEFSVNHIADTPEVSEKGRFNKDYARFCLIKHYLNEGSHMAGYYEKAVQLCEQMKREGRYSLYRSGNNPYAEQFTSAHKFNEEVIMAISCTSSANGSGSGGNMNNICKYTLPKDASLTPGSNPEFDPAMSGWFQYFNISPKFYDSFEPDDLRRATIVTSYLASNGAIRNASTIGRTWDGYVINKFKPEVMGEMQPMDIPTARWADVLLMYAEALVRRDNYVSQSAVRAVEEVRERAGLGSLSASKTASVDVFLDTILDERGFEFFFEGFRKIDLIRFNQYARRTYRMKAVAPTHQYLPVPDYAVEMAAKRGVELTQTYTRPGWAADISAAR